MSGRGERRMNEREAIEIIKNTRIKLGRANGKDLINQAFNIAIEALEKQAPKKPNGFNSECWDCGEFLLSSQDQPSYCPSCGQKIDWSEEE